MKTKYYLLRALYAFRHNFLKYLSITSITIAVLLVFYAISTSILTTYNLFSSLGGYILFILTAVIICLLLNPILEAYVFSIDVTKDSSSKDVKNSQTENTNIFSSYLKNFIEGIKLKLRLQNRGSVKVFKNILRSVLIYLFLFILCQLITMLVFYYTDRTAYEMYNTYLFGEDTSSIDLELLSEYISTPLFISNFVSLLISFLSYFYFLFTYLFKSSLGNSYYMILKSNRLANTNETYKENRMVFLKPYLFILSFILLLFSIAFSLCYFLLYYLTNSNNLIFITETSLFVGILFILLFVPALFELFKALKITFNVYFLMNFVSYIEKHLSNLSIDEYGSFQDKERALFIMKLYKNDLHQVVTLGNLYYMQLNIEYDLFNMYQDLVDQDEMNIIKSFMETNQVIKEELGIKEETK